MKNTQDLKKVKSYNKVINLTALRCAPSSKLSRRYAFQQ